jgi:TATA-box binding protein (TBP) (component of TFIID and TFIIIB)
MTTDLLNNKIQKPLIFSNFDDIKVSTKTFIVMTNLLIDLKKLFEFLPVTEYNFIPKKRGRKKKNITTDTTKNVPQGSIVTLKYENSIRGIDLKPKKSLSKKKKSKWFRNSFTVVIILDDKPINFKVCKNGKFQVTGVKTDKQVEDCIKYIWYYINNKEGDIFKFSSGDFLEAIFIPAMRNIDFSVGFNVDREKFARYMTHQNDMHSLLETSFGYTGVNVKCPVETDRTRLELKRLTYEDHNNPVENIITYGEYLKLLPKKEQIKKLNKKIFITFLIFHSGKVICSGLTGDYMREPYNFFINIVQKARHEIEEKLDV